jgi:uncharacterized membrane protein
MSAGPARAGAGFPRWASPVNLVLGIVGLGVAGYLTYEHYTSSTSLSCPATGGIVNCVKVTTSTYSMIQGVPVAVLGLVFFAVMMVLQSPPAWRIGHPAVVWGRVVWSVAGVGTAIWLIYAELFEIQAICLWCTSVHIISVLLFISTAFATASRDIDYDDREAGQEAPDPLAVS